MPARQRRQNTRGDSGVVWFGLEFWSRDRGSKKEKAGKVIMATPKTVCRMCTTNKMVVFVNLLDAVENKRSACEILQTLAGVQATKKDGRSTKICVNCFSKLETYEKLRRSVVEAQGKLYGPKAVENLKSQKGKKKARRVEPVTCHHCDLEFPDPEDMVAHLREIARCSIFSCKYCPAYFDEHGKLKQHMEEEHVNKPESTDNPESDNE
ncbi:hypothetical protein B566_EDAN010677 [Ephemera danica]|nr:hypothetical protein B566_EDAN010677 [Ephemera danica]